MSTLRILLVDDSEDEALFLEDDLLQGGYEPSLQRVDTEKDMRNALKNQEWDVIIIDYVMPYFSAPAAMQVYHDLALDIPCLIMSGQITDEKAVTMMREGARDFIPKNQRSRLLPAISRELQESRERREHKQAEKALLEVQRRHASIFQSAEIAIWEEDFSALFVHLQHLRKAGIKDLKQYLQCNPGTVLDCISLVRLIDVNPAALRMLGADNKQQLLLSLDTVFTETAVAVFAQELNAIWMGQPFFHSEAQHRRLDGEEITVMLSMPIPQEAAGFSYIPVSLLDITAYKRSQQARERIAQKNRLILDTAGEGIFGLDAKGRHTFVNPSAANMLGYTVEELIGRPSHATWHYQHPDGSDFHEQQCPIYRAMRNCKVYRGEDYFTHKNTYMFPVEFEVSPMIERGEICGAVVSFRDISQRKQGEETLLRTNRALNTLSQCNQTLIHAQDEISLLQALCQILEQAGEYAVAWVGLYRHKQHLLYPVAWGKKTAILYKVKYNIMQMMNQCLPQSPKC